MGSDFERLLKLFDEKEDGTIVALLYPGEYREKEAISNLIHS